MRNEFQRRLSKRLAAAAATDYEHDDDFAFVRKSKRTKADKTDEPKPEEMPEPKVEKVKKSTKGRPAAKQGATKAPATNGTIVEGPPKEETIAITRAMTVESKKRKASVDASDEREISDLQRPPSTRRSGRQCGEAQEDEASQQAPAPAPAPASISESELEPQPEPIPKAAPTFHIDEAPEKSESRRRPPRLPPDWNQSSQRKPSVQSITVALPMSDTPIINRNKETRKKGGNSNRRSSLGNRGRRASSLIEDGQTAIPHREVEPADFYKHIEAEGLTEPRRMRQLLTWCGERALAREPPRGTPNSNAILGSRAIQDQLLKDFAARSEFSDWFSREDDAPKVPVVLRPNPRNKVLGEKLSQLEINMEKLQGEKKTWQAIRKPMPEQPLLFYKGETGRIILPDFDLLDPDEGKIRGFLADAISSFDAIRSQTESRLRTVQSSLEFQVDQLADNIHKLEQRVLFASKEVE